MLDNFLEDVSRETSFKFSSCIKVSAFENKICVALILYILIYTNYILICSGGIFSEVSRFMSIYSAIKKLSFKISCKLLVGVLCASFLFCMPPQNSYANMPDTFASVAEVALPGVVNISTTAIVKRQRIAHPFMKLEEFFNHSFPFLDGENNSEEPEGRREEYSRGTGFIIDSAGYIVTNYHVIDGADEVFVRFNDDDAQEIEAEVIGFDQRTDLALLKIDYPEKLPALAFGNPNNSKVGDWVVAIGNPFGLGGTVTSGIISAKARSMQIGYNDLIQTDASINLGNSGGPMLNMEAKVIGVNRIILSRTGTNIGIGFAVSANTVKYVVESIKKYGKVIRPWFGFYFQPLDEKIAENLGLQDEKGVIISRTFPNSPAHDAGLESGDVITHIDGARIDKSNLFSVMLGKEVDKKVELTVLRDGKQVLVEAIPQEEPEKGELSAFNKSSETENGANGPEFEEEYQFGLKVKDLNDQHRERFNVTDDVDGVLIESVRKGSAAHFVGLKPGMVILSVNKKDTKSAKEFKKVCEQAQKDGKNSTLLLVYVEGVIQFIVMRER